MLVLDFYLDKCRFPRNDTRQWWGRIGSPMVECASIDHWLWSLQRPHWTIENVENRCVCFSNTWTWMNRRNILCVGAPVLFCWPPDPWPSQRSGLWLLVWLVPWTLPHRFWRWNRTRASCTDTGQWSANRWNWNHGTTFDGMYKPVQVKTEWKRCKRLKRQRVHPGKSILACTATVPGPVVIEVVWIWSLSWGERGEPLC